MLKGTMALHSFGVWLKCVLADREMKQRDLAELIGVTEQAVSRYVHGARLPNQETLNQILDLFGFHMEIVQNEEPEVWRDGE